MHENAINTEPEVTETQQWTLLFVDDEVNILAALKRLFRPHGYRVLTAESGRQGVEVLERESVDLVISDMRMPEMNGAQFLEQVRGKWPGVIRILLTGYAEIGSTVDAINKGQIYRYISKPWEDNEVILLVEQALERKMLEQEKMRLEALTQQQNEALKELNSSLEQKVQERTAELRQAMGVINVAHEKLKQSFLTSIHVFSNLIELREGALAGHSRRVADLARRMALRMNVAEPVVQDVLIAGLLHDIGKFGLPDKLIQKPFGALTPEERAEVIKHPARGQGALMALEQLKGAAEIIRSHHERFDGQGYPDGLAGLAIPLGARILAVANDYDALQIGSLTSQRMSAEAATLYIKEGRGKRYDPHVVDAFLGAVGVVAPSASSRVGELATTPGELRPGMVLARDIVTRDGVLLLSKDFLLDERLIAQIRNFEKSDGKPLPIFVKTGRR